jgi:hypothetical protein
MKPEAGGARNEAKEEEIMKAESEMKIWRERRRKLKYEPNSKARKHMARQWRL